jgi:hypothetical protein
MSFRPNYNLIEYILVRLAVLLTIGVFISFHFRLAQEGLGMDFDVYYRAASRMLRMDYSNIYNFWLDGISPYRYAPLTLPLFLPFAFFPLALARYFWFYVQFSAVFLGYFFIYKTFVTLKIRPLLSTLIIFSLTFRFAIDSFNIGQITPVLFCCLAGAAYSYLKDRQILGCLFLIFPTITKVGFGLLYFLFLFPLAGFSQFVLISALGFVSISAFLVFWMQSFSDYAHLWKTWILVMKSHQVYFDASIIGSQSLLAVLLRVFSNLAIATLYLTRKPFSAVGKALFFALGVLSFILFMPESFKHAYLLMLFSFVPLLTLAVLENRSENIYRKSIPWIFIFSFLSVSGRDILGPQLFEFYQKSNIPFVLCFIVFIWTGLSAKRYSAFKFKNTKPGVLPSLTADDWGMCRSVNQGILDLAQAGLIRRVSLFAGLKKSNYLIEELSSIPTIKLGIHFNLTYGTPLGMERSPGQFFLGWLLGQHRPSQIRAIFLKQMSELNKIGVYPVYFDSHHHCHLVPGLVFSLRNELRKAKIDTIRTTYDDRLWFSRKFILNILGLINRLELKLLGFKWIPCCYPQITDFLLPEKLEAVILGKYGHDIIVHPARLDDFSDFEFPDSMTTERVDQYRALKRFVKANGTIDTHLVGRNPSLKEVSELLNIL